jgi:hypothetical protein
VIITTIDGRRIRDQEVTDSLRSAIESTVDNLRDSKYDINDNQIFIADFIQALAIQIESDSTIQVNILDVDYEKGILSIEVIEHFKHPNGKSGTVSAVKTMIFEKDTTSSGATGPPELVTITYNLPGNVLYKQFSIIKGSEIIIPKDPLLAGKTFKQWTLNGTGYALTDVSNNKIKISNNISLQAEFE